jgi:hypothetical protein
MMKTSFLLFCLIAGSLVGFGCDGAINSEYQEQLVVSGYLVAGSPIDSIVLHRTTPFGVFLDDLGSSVDSANVVIIVDGVEHTLLPGTRKGRYFLPNTELTVVGGKTYELRVTYHGQVLQSMTTVPMPIHFIGLNDSIPSRNLILDTTNLRAFNYSLTAGPIDQPNRKYMLQVTALDPTKGRIETSQAGPPVDTNGVTRYSFVHTAPQIGISPRLFGWYGPNKISFIAADTNWVDERRQNIGERSTYQSSLSHVSGGYGTFASGARDTVTVWISPKR